MPNTFLESYFKSRELTQQKKLQEQQLAQRQVEQAQQLGLQQQQLQLQSVGQQQAQAFQNFQMEQAKKDQEYRQKQDLMSRQWNAMVGVGQGSLQPVQAPLVPGVIGLHAPPKPGEMDIEGYGRIAPTTPFQRGMDAISLKTLGQDAEDQQKLQSFNKYLQIAVQKGAKLDPNMQGKLFLANTMPNANAVGLLNDLPNSFGEAGAQAVQEWGTDLTRRIISNPQAAFAPETVREMRNFNSVREMYEGKPAAAMYGPGGQGMVRDADAERRASQTMVAFTEAMSKARIDPNTINAGDQFEAMKTAIIMKLGAGNFSLDAFTKAVDDYKASHPRLNILDNATARPAVPVR